MENNSKKPNNLLQILFKVSSLLVLIIALSITWEVVARYVFNNPTTWVWTLSRQVFGLFILVAGIYASYCGGHIRIEIFYDRFPPFIKKIADLINMILFLLFFGALIWKGSMMAKMAIASKEHARGLFHMPVYPLKTLIPILAFLFILQRVIKYIQKKGNI